MSVLIASPSAGTVDAVFCKALCDLVKYETAYGRNVDVFLKEGPYIHDNRNKMVREFLKGPWSHLLMLDIDLVFEPNLLERLLSHGKDVVFGLYLRLFEMKPSPLFFRRNSKGRYEPVKGSGLMELDGAGTGISLFTRKVFEEIKGYPESSRWFDYKQIGETEEFLSEDLTFCQRVREAGFTIYGDADIYSAHQKPVLIQTRAREKAL